MIILLTKFFRFLNFFKKTSNLNVLRKINLDPKQNSNKILNQTLKIIIKLLIIINVSSKIDRSISTRNNLPEKLKFSIRFHISTQNHLILSNIQIRKIIIRNNVKSIWKIMIIWIKTDFVPLKIVF